MRVRKLDANGDYTIGQGQANFYINNVQAVAQNIQTRLLLWVGEWFLDNTIYMPWAQDVLGYSKTTLRDMAIKTVILGTQGVVSLNSYSAVFNSATRNLAVSGTVVTIFSTTPVPFGPVIL